MQTIKVKPNEDGKIIVKLFGKEFDVTNTIDKNGKGTLSAFGDVYQLEVIDNKKAKKIATGTSQDEPERVEQAQTVTEPSNDENSTQKDASDE